ncbi:hypothetical protein J3R30DRAFT_918956 [Lentinula aciculospora]|uniref:Uncharacterized protein n=1 Tax=Lentinula aciculospora TaxID=153920 RepID=A0A9W9DVN4_9AGAR|nr:hypothetical protein J3R30DRAFT_918956 [Lentinula aciculospora]
MGVGLGLTQPSGSPQNEVSRPSTQTWTRSASVTASKPPTKTSSVFGIGKTLSRKMSGRLGVPKRAPSFDVGPVTSAPAILVQEHARTSLHERRAMPKKVSETSGSRGDAPNLQLSMDNRATPKGSLPPPKISPTLHRPSPTQDGEIHTPLLKTSLISSPQPSPTSATSHSGSKNKIWNLMKRISTGGLRDNYRDNGAGIPTSPLPPPPPVPALPKDLVMYPTEMVRKARADVTEMLHKRNDTSTTIQSPNGKHSSPGSIRPPTTPARMNVPLETPTSSTRPGTATRSSSPISSSDIGSSRFFNRTQSQRSSTSSYGDQIPPVPTAPGVRLQQHILPPSELYQLHLNLERSKDESQTRAMASSKSTNYSHSLSSLNTTPSISHSRSQVNLKLQTQAKSAPTEDWMIVPTPMEEKSGFSLPVPRRQKGSDNIEEAILRRPPLAYDNRRITSTDEVTRSSTGTASRQAKISGSPVAYGAPNAYSTASGVSGGNVGSRLSSPAIPLKSPRRVASASSASSTWSGRISSPTMPPLPATSSAVSAGGHQKLPEAHMKSDAESSRRAMRKSLGFGIPSEKTPINFVRKRTHSNSSRPRTSPAAHISSTTPSRLPQSETSQHPRSHTFGVLSDKEKDDKWDDLLERSKRAGGTLHVNGGLKGLDSDRLQFSVNDSGDELDEL